MLDQSQPVVSSVIALTFLETQLTLIITLPHSETNYIPTFMKVFSLIPIILLGLSLSESNAQNQRIRDLDHVYTIDLSEIDSKSIDELKTIRYVSVVDFKEGVTLTLKSSQDESTKAIEEIQKFVLDPSAIKEQNGVDYIKK